MKKTFSAKLKERLRDSTITSLTYLEKKLYAMGVFLTQGAYTSDKYSEYEINELRIGVNGNAISQNDIKEIIRIQKTIKRIHTTTHRNCETGEEEIIEKEIL